MLRFYHFEDLFERLDSNLPYPTTIRILHTVKIMIYLIHLSACAFYTFSDYKGLGSTDFVFDGEGSDLGWAHLEKVAGINWIQSSLAGDSPPEHFEPNWRSVGECAILHLASKVLASQY